MEIVQIVPVTAMVILVVTVVARHSVLVTVMETV